MLPAAAAAAAGAGGSKLMRPAVEVGTGPPPRRYKVTMLGAPGVGKSALTSQFLSSDHMNTYDNVGESVRSCTVWGVHSDAMFCFVVFLKFWLPVGLHSSCSISHSAGGTCQKCSVKHHNRAGY